MDAAFTGKVWLFDFTNHDENDWLAVNQFTIVDRGSGKVLADARPDVVVFKAVGFGKPRQIEPVLSPSFSIGRRRQQTIDQFLIRGC